MEIYDNNNQLIDLNSALELANKEVKENSPKKSKLEETFAKEREEWKDRVASISFKLNKLHEIPEIMIILYSERQRAVEYYHYLLSVLVKINIQYRKLYAERQNYYAVKSQLKFANENLKHNRILVDLEEYVKQREMIEIHSKYINSTISTLDNIIYAIPKRVEIETILRGGK